MSRPLPPVLAFLHALAEAPDTQAVLDAIARYGNVIPDRWPLVAQTVQAVDDALARQIVTHDPGSAPLAAAHAGLTEAAAEDLAHWAWQRLDADTARGGTAGPETLMILSRTGRLPTTSRVGRHVVQRASSPSGRGAGVHARGQAVRILLAAPTVPPDLLQTLTRAWGQHTLAVALAAAGHPSAAPTLWAQLAPFANEGDLVTVLQFPRIWTNPRVQNWLRTGPANGIVEALAILASRRAGAAFREAWILLRERDEARAVQLLRGTTRAQRAALVPDDVLPLCMATDYPTRELALQIIADLGAVPASSPATLTLPPRPRPAAGHPSG